MSHHIVWFAEYNWTINKTNSPTYNCTQCISNYYHKNHKSINRSAKLSNYAINDKREMIILLSVWTIQVIVTRIKSMFAWLWAASSSAWWSFSLSWLSLASWRLCSAWKFVRPPSGPSPSTLRVPPITLFRRLLPKPEQEFGRRFLKKLNYQTKSIFYLVYRSWSIISPKLWVAGCDQTVDIIPVNNNERFTYFFSVVLIQIFYAQYKATIGCYSRLLYVKALITHVYGDSS